ncbi:uncharacterized protein LOC143267458 [Peromyscus maniculatus bairdii]|uniref:uncharacterized protein LOC143267458 n=1 Tax=Peromyscus maniculatus bairdii TaxID=230844 RepID=UPI003FD16736
MSEKLTPGDKLSHPTLFHVFITSGLPSFNSYKTSTVNMDHRNEPVRTIPGSRTAHGQEFYFLLLNSTHSAMSSKAVNNATQIWNTSQRSRFSSPLPPPPPGGSSARRIPGPRKPDRRIPPTPCSSLTPHQQVFSSPRRPLLRRRRARGQACKRVREKRTRRRVRRWQQVMAPTRRRGRREARAPGRPLPSPRRPSAVMAVAAAGAGAPRASSRPRGRGAVAGVRGGAGGGSPHSPLSPAVHVSRAGGGVRPAGPWFSAWRLTADLELVQTRGFWSRGPAAAQAGPGAGPATSRHGARRPPARLAGPGRRRPAAAQAGPGAGPATSRTRVAGSLRRRRRPRSRQRPTAARSEGRWIARRAAERRSRQRRRRRTWDVAGARRRGRGWGRRGTAPWPATRSDVPRPAPAQYEKALQLMQKTV